LKKVGIFYILKLMERIWIKDIVGKVGQQTDLFGWVDNRRDHGKIIFIDLRDRTGICQVVFGPWSGKELYAQAEKLRNEWVVKISGEVKERPSDMINKNISTGTVEVNAEFLEILNEAQTPPFDVTTDGKDVDEEIRMKYRYLDLRRPRLQKNLELRHKIVKFIRDYLTNENFYEIETPIITKATPEGARDYVVPSRLYSGKFYALPQSPQQYKQLLMVAGFERYFQIAKCFRDEDTRGDRQPEFTQLDLEMSFVNQEDVLKLTENLYTELVGKLLPDHRITQTSWPRMTYLESMEKYGTDKPDLRGNKNDPKELAFVFVVDFPMFEKNKEGNWTSVHHPFTMMKKEHLKYLDSGELDKIYADSYDLVLNGYEVASGSIRINQPEIQKKVFNALGLTDEVVMNKFGHMIEAFKYGAPPHGGIAPGIDRFVMIVANEPNIREVIAFPKTGDARDLMMEAPSELEKNQLDELHLQIKETKKKPSSRS